MSVGKAIQRIRLDKGMTQRAVSERAGLAVSYVSRIENDRVQPTMKTMKSIAGALEIPVSRIFAIEESTLTSLHKCPVSSSGQCIGELIRSAQGQQPKGRRATYGKLELRMLRLTDFIAVHGSAEVRRTLSVVLESLVARSDSGPQI